MQFEYTIENEQHLEHLASELGEFIQRKLQDASVVTIGLEGELGAGKTTLVRFLVKALGSPAPVSSPSYTLQHIYESEVCLAPAETRSELHIVTPRAPFLVIEHWDLYRLRQLPEEMLEQSSGFVVRLVEWASRCPELQLDGTITLTSTGEETRLCQFAGRLFGQPVVI